MDTSSISAVAASAQGLQVQASAQPATTGNTARTPDVAATKDVNVDKPVDEEVRTRDPRSLQYQVDGSTKQVVATIVDENNKTVVVQIPSEEMLRIAQAIDRMKGFLLEGKA